MDLQFKPIEIDNIPELLPYYTMRQNKTCDSVFLESFIWKEYYNVRYAIWEGKALLWLMENNGKCFSAMPLCREEDLPGAFKAIEQYFNEVLGYPLVINLADEYAVQILALPEEKYLIEEQVDSRDYLYDGEAMRVLGGKKLHKKKNRINAFKRNYEGRYEYRRLCCSDSHEIWKFLDRWRQQKGEDVEEHLDYEVRGIHDILKNCSELYVRMGGVFIDNVLEAFTIGSYNPVENMAVIHIEKANPDFNGLYQYINQQFLLEEFPNVAWVNREDDMGIDGLREAKMSYSPADFARKYLVEQLLDGKKGYHWAGQIGNTLAGSRFEYLADEDKKDTIRLWHSCFPEDSEQFIEYYYSEKVKDNRILVKKDNGLILSMVQYNPYQICMKDRDWGLDYLVGVATEASRRREGHFRDVFQKMFEDMRGDKKPITYLVPVNPDVYAPLGFTFIGNLPVFELTEAAEEKLSRTPCRDIPEDCERAASYMERWLAARFEMYTRRDGAYVSRLVKELASENGTLEFLWDKEELVGVQAFWGIEQREQRLLYAEEAYTVKTGEKPWNMARLTNPDTFLTAFRLKGEGQLNLALQIDDPILKENSGTYHWNMDKNGSSLERLDCREQVTGPETGQKLVAAELAGREASGKEYADASAAEFSAAELSAVKLAAGPSELVSWLCGYRKAGEIWPELTMQDLEQLERVDTINGVLLDEIV